MLEERFKNSICNERLEYLKDINELKCMKCLQIPYYPIICHSCGHVICFECENDLDSQECTFCKNPFKSKEVPINLKNKFSSLSTKCQFEGCNKLVHYSNLLKHEKT